MDVDSAPECALLDLLINLLASVIAGAAVWAAQRLLRYRKLDRQRQFFGVRPGEEVLLFVGKHFSSPKENSVHRNDVASLIELTAVIKQCGGEPTLLSADEKRPQAGRASEYCVGGPSVNPRTDAHMKTTFPGVLIPYDDDADGDGLHQLTYIIGGEAYTCEPGVTEYVLLARAFGPSHQRPAFLLIGQTSRSNIAGARYLASRYLELVGQYPGQDNFCLLLRIRNSTMFGPDYVELVGDVTAAATTAPPAPAQPTPVP